MLLCNLYHHDVLSDAMNALEAYFMVPRLHLNSEVRSVVPDRNSMHGWTVSGVRGAGPMSRFDCSSQVVCSCTVDLRGASRMPMVTSEDCFAGSSSLVSSDLPQCAGKRVLIVGASVSASEMM